MAIDYSVLSDNDLMSLKNNDYANISDEGLQYLKTSQKQQEVYDTADKALKTGQEALNIGGNNNFDYNVDNKGNVTLKTKIEYENPINFMKDYIGGNVTPSSFIKNGITNARTTIDLINNPDEFYADYRDEQGNYFPNGYADVFSGYIDKLNEERSRIKNIEKEHPFIYKPWNITTDMLAYSRIPMVSALKGGNFLSNVGNGIINAPLRGGLPYALENLKEGKNSLSGLGLGAAIDLGTQAVMGGLGAIAKRIGKPLWKFVANKMGRLTPETIEQAIKPRSQALDLTEDEAQQLLLNTTQKVRNDYADLLRQKGDEVGTLIEELPNNVQFKANDLSDDVFKVLTRYSKSGNIELNPAVNASKKQVQAIDDLLYGSQSERVEKFKNEIDKLKFEHKKKEFVTYGANGHYGNMDTAPLNNALIQAERDTNDLLASIKKEIAADPKLLENDRYFDRKELNMATILRRIPQEYQAVYYEKLYKAFDLANILNKENMSRTPLELYDINKNISGMTNWAAKTDNEKLSNEVLRQIYGTYADRISSLSPKLADANKVYSDLMDLKNNDAVNQVLRGDLYNNGIMGAAPTALKNYKTNITSGNKARNIQELEKILYDNGYGTFTDKIDDINAAQNLLKSENTGDSMIANLSKALLLRPSLKLARWGNKTDIPKNAQKIYKHFQNNLAKYLLGGYEIVE